ncbi:MAG: hypothetical protein J6B92_07325 [Paraprevotella sp.]|nr:hypothetical protein [Paraprevotella sp.]
MDDYCDIMWTALVNISKPLSWGSPINIRESYHVTVSLPGLQSARVMDNLCHSRSNAVLRSWHTPCYGCGIRLATVVAYALLRLWHTLSAWCENN